MRSRFRSSPPAGPEGEEEALTYGWQPPFPARMPLLRRYSYADALADRIVGQAFVCLTPAERGELVAGLDAAAALVTPSG